MECKHCGNCCYQGTLPESLWEEGLTKEEKERLIRDRKIYSVKPCKMLVFENDVAFCLVQKVLGKKPKLCKEWKCGKVT